MYIRIYYDKIINENENEYVISVNENEIQLPKEYISNQKNHLSKPLPGTKEENEIDIPYFDIPEWLAVREGLC